MKSYIGVFALLILASCGKNTEEYLYNKHSKEFKALQAMQAKQCEDGSKAFKEMKKRNDFLLAGFKNESFYEIKIKRDGKERSSEYLKIENVTADTMVIHYHAGESGDRKSIQYKRKNNNDIIHAVSAGVCAPAGKKYTNGNKNNPTLFNFSDTREKVHTRNSDNDPLTFTRKTEDFTVDIDDYPMIFMLWNKTLRKRVKTNVEEEEKFEYAVHKVERSVCLDRSKHPVCATADFRYPDFRVEVNTAAYKSDALDSEIVRFLPEENANEENANEENAN